MNLVELTSYLVKSLVKDPDSVSVKEMPTEDDSMLIEVLVSNDEIGSVIGKGGKIANSIRTIVQASSYMNDNRVLVSKKNKVIMYDMRVNDIIHIFDVKEMKATAMTVMEDERVLLSSQDGIVLMDNTIHFN